MLDYRVKPEKKYRPYNSAEEFLAAQKEHGMYIQGGSGIGFHLPTYIGIGNIELKEGFLSYEDILEDCYHWVDGTPCGILKV